MRPALPPPVVIVPGLRGHVPDHWQTVLADGLAAAGRDVRTVPPLTGDDDRLDCEARAAALEETVSRAPGPPILVAHSAGVMTTVHWALRTGRPVHGALLATPPDFDTPLPEGYPTPEALRQRGWAPTPLAALPFPSIVAMSDDDPLGHPKRVAAMASAWGSRLIGLGAVGHLNPASGYGPWPQAAELVRELEFG
ncbi:RBBP9/YdeN family alpha/beta hydrolase [Kitasatospora sp. DSM 101779]|uniref:RBBP9/YdeN family alpha/beta hydrolase n=1 Tax=Kitasatospora sp. DSM 101779 TaxID=2853165 RepID=UPI0021D8D218|nr:alpha/beta fold hydrolase [Kitasatospora sp. DSM 101779]MCU7820855.1 alpha/beta fold hydrolase [Kitasatospora sp. DSM 101779]